MWTSFLLALAVIASTHSMGITPISQCTSNPGELPINVYIDGCTVLPCLLPQLQDAIVNVVFKAPRHLTSMTTLATAFLPFLQVPYDLGDNAVTCNAIENSYCPILQEEVVMYTLRMYIESFMIAGIQLAIEFRVVDQDSVPVFCFRTTIRTAAPVETRNNSTLVMGDQ